MKEIEEINNIREMTKSISNNFCINSAKLSIDLRRFRGEELESISWNDYFAFKTGEWLRIDDKVKFIRTSCSDITMTIQLCMERGGKIGWHYHPDCTELLTIINGTMIDLQTDTIYKRGDSVEYKPMEEHIIFALEDVAITVIINKTLD
jgi:mannose-6-phosphate isomerase-like protein (cupin superfamily)